MAELKYSVEHKPYRTKIDHYLGTSCARCKKKIAKGRPAIGVRSGSSFSYYHVTCYPKSNAAKWWKAKAKK